MNNKNHSEFFKKIIFIFRFLIIIGGLLFYCLYLITINPLCNFLEKKIDRRASKLAIKDFAPSH